MQNISFTGKADIIFSTKLFDKLSNGYRVANVGENFQYFFEKSKWAPRAKSEFANTCTMGVVNNGKDQFVFHIAPESPNSNLTERFLKVVDKLKENADENLTAFITGGRSNNPKSFDTMNRIANALDSEGVDLSIIWGKASNFVDNMYANIKQSHIILNPSRKFVAEPPALLGLKDLQKTYDIVEISPAHSVLFK